ncbi:hypothetical protein GCM10010413_37910 [Promicromonospora sukumoe]
MVGLVSQVAGRVTCLSTGAKQDRLTLPTAYTADRWSHPGHTGLPIPSGHRTGPDRREARGCRSTVPEDPTTEIISIGARLSPELSHLLDDAAEPMFTT